MGAKKNETFSVDGTDIAFRVIEPNDVPALQRFHERLSQNTVYLRFFGSTKEFSEEKARYFAHIDGVDHYALVALDPEDPDDIIAVVRYDREPGEEKAEYAALVEDRWQGCGVGLELTHRLIDQARDKGIRYLYGLVMRENRRMLHLLRELDLPEQERQESGVKRFEVSLQVEEQ